MAEKNPPEPAKGLISVRRYAFRFQAGHERKSGAAACEKDRLRTILIRDEQYLGLNHESGFPQPGCHLVRLAALDVAPHRVAAMALRLQPRLVASMKHELDRRPAEKQIRP
ncbi:hypothetical protein [Saccharopolyspora pogona]|uniref:hypothetical protein n=1 Tax=Saccharopolyspora pogona TaxID=333966 RepID=UPI0016831D75|nr:hypothetical protein [Saccharopolyspora pogona]